MRSRLAAAVTHYALGNYRQGVRACEATLGLLDGEAARERFGISVVRIVNATKGWYERGTPVRRQRCAAQSVT